MLESYRRLFLFILLLAFLSSCSLPQTRPAPEKKAVLVGVETVDQIARKEVMQTATKFTLNYYENTYAWERAKLFFKEHTSGFLGERKIGSSKLLLSNIESEKDPFIFEVERLQSEDGFSYSITCFSADHGKDGAADLNARNLARFIRAGQLERGLL